MDPAEDSLHDLLQDVLSARVALHSERRQALGTRLEMGPARHRLILALRAYQSALAQGGAPMPYRLRDELRLLQALDEERRGF